AERSEREGGEPGYEKRTHDSSLAEWPLQVEGHQARVRHSALALNRALRRDASNLTRAGVSPVLGRASWGIATSRLRCQRARRWRRRRRSRDTRTRESRRRSTPGFPEHGRET